MIMQYLNFNIGQLLQDHYQRHAYFNTGQFITNTAEIVM